MPCSCIAPEYQRKYDPINRGNELKQILLIQIAMKYWKKHGKENQKDAAYEVQHNPSVKWGSFKLQKSCKWRLLHFFISFRSV